MKPRDLIDIQLDGIFGTMMPKKVQALVDSELNAGKWQDGYDIAINPDGLGNVDGQILLDILLRQHPDLKIDTAKLLALVEKDLPQSNFTKVLWLVADDCSFILTDSLQVARYHNFTRKWVTPRISLDGIELVSTDMKVIRGLAYLGSTYEPDLPFTLSFHSGDVLEGKIIEY